MQNFICSETGAGYAFEDDVVVEDKDGCNVFYTAGGERLVNVPATLVAHAGELPAPKPTAADVRRTRDLILGGSDWIVLRHRDEIDAGLPTSISIEQYGAWLDYRRLLRALPDQEGFPENVDWPEAPPLLN